MRPIEVRLVGRFRFVSRVTGTHQHLLYNGEHTQSGQYLFLKGQQYRCRPSQNFLSILQQGKILQIMQGGIGIPHMHWCGQEEDYNFIVLEHFDKSLSQIQTLCGGTFSIKTVLSLGMEMLNILQYFHFKLFIHNQICPKNIMLGQGDKFGKFYLVDYCGASRYKDSQSLEHVSSDRKVQPRMINLQFSSLNYNKGEAISRRDDMQSLLYMMAFWLKGKLPWSEAAHSQKKTQSERTRMVLKIKQQTSEEQIFSGYPELLMLFQYTKKLQFDEKPRYIYYRNVLIQRLQQLGLIDDKVYDWMLLQSQPIQQQGLIDFDIVPNQAEFIKQVIEQLKSKQKIISQNKQPVSNIASLQSPRSKLKQKQCQIY